MNARQPSLLLSLADRAYRLLLYAYPASFRRRFGAEMGQVFSLRSQEMLQERGVAGLAGWWVLCVLDLARGALLERSSEMDWKRWIITGLAILLLVPPFAFWLGGGPYRLGSDLGSAAASLRANGWAVWPPASRTTTLRVIALPKPNGEWTVQLPSFMVPNAPLFSRAAKLA